MKKSDIKYVNVPIAYDIETTNYRSNGEPRSIIYSHAYSDNGVFHLLRTWEENLAYVQTLIDKYNVSLTNRLVIYIHNESFEFGFIKHYFEWEDVFAIGSTHRVARALTTSGIEFRCSYLLTNSSLKLVGDDVNVPKMMGDLDYKLMRHPGTPLTKEEIGYIENDVQIVVALIAKKIAQDNHINNIPMTKTGYVRRAVKQAIKPVNGDYSYQNKLKKMPLSEKLYQMTKTAFQGGYTHANACYSGKIMYGVIGVDLASSYPASMVKGMFPTGNFNKIALPTWEDIEGLKGKKAVYFTTLTFHNLISKTAFPPISLSKAFSVEHPTVDNGRVFSADKLSVTITNVDLEIYLKAYDIESVDVHALHVAPADHLPRKLVDAILKFYGDKTKLKGVEGMQEWYDLAKENTNSIYGMVGTDPIHTEMEFDNYAKEMLTLPTDLFEAIYKHNESFSRFLYFPWGAWVTAYSRKTLLLTIYEMEEAGIQVLYCDTDSIYYVDNPLAAAIIDKVNSTIVNDMSAYFSGYDQNMAYDKLAPKTKNGDRKFLGIFEPDGTYKQFKTLGAKRYATIAEKDGKDRFSITVAGLNKKAGDHFDYDAGEWVEGYVTKMGGMDFFKDGMTIPKEHSGRLIHTYSDEHFTDYIEDYLGNRMRVEQHGFVHLEESHYTLSISDEYHDFMLKVDELLPA